MLVVVHRAHGLRYGRGDGEAKVVPSTIGSDPELVRVVGMTRADERRMMRETRKHQTALLARWSELHGGY